MNAIRLRGLRHVYPGGVEALRGIDIEIPVGSCFGLLGPNGAGKSTTFEILNGLIQPTSGTVELLGKTWRADAPWLRERVGVQFQETQFYEKLSVAETLTLFRSFYGARGLDPAEAIRLVHLDEKATAHVGQLSGGQRQRLALAVALVGDPELLLLDEPTTGLDPQSRRALWAIVTDWVGRGRTVLLSTHYMDEAEQLCDRLAVIDGGLVIAEGTPRELIARLGGDHVIEFAADGPLDPAALPVAVHSLPNGRMGAAVTDLHRTLPALLSALDRSGVGLTELTTRSATLEDVFVELTGRSLRDG